MEGGVKLGFAMLQIENLNKMGMATGSSSHIYSVKPGYSRLVIQIGSFKSGHAILGLQTDLPCSPAR
jgi:hypothetical protein